MSTATSTNGKTALLNLMSGNQAYLSNLAEGRSANLELGGFEKFKTFQTPQAAVLFCADSRVAPEIVFNQGIGDIFVVRSAGNYVDELALASLEYAVAALKTPLLFVVGHTGCGAVKASIDFNAGHRDGLTPSLVSLCEKVGHALGTEVTDLTEAVHRNVQASLNHILESSEVIREFAGSGKIVLAQGVYDLESGRVELINEHRDQVQTSAPKEVRA